MWHCLPAIELERRLARQRLRLKARFGRKDFLPVEAQGGLSFLFRLSEPEAAPEASRSFSVSEKLARYGSSALSGVEHLTLLVGKKSVALALIRHFGSLKGLARASFRNYGNSFRGVRLSPLLPH
jgi:hypothetical protein